MDDIRNVRDMLSQKGSLTPNEQLKAEQICKEKPSQGNMIDFTSQQVEDFNSFVSIGKGYIIDMKKGRITFDIRKFIEEKSGQQVSNKFIEQLKSSNCSNAYLSIKKLASESSDMQKDSLKLDLSAKKEQAETILKKMLKEFSIFSRSSQGTDFDKEISFLC